MNYCMSPEAIADRKTLREVAKSAAEQAGRETQDVLQVLVSAKMRQKHSDCPDAVPEAIRFQMGLHHSDELRELTSYAISMLDRPDHQVCKN